MGLCRFLCEVGAQVGEGKTPATFPISAPFSLSKLNNVSFSNTECPEPFVSTLRTFTVHISPFRELGEGFVKFRKNGSWDIWGSMPHCNFWEIVLLPNANEEMNQHSWRGNVSPLCNFPFLGSNSEHFAITFVWLYQLKDDMGEVIWTQMQYVKETKTLVCVFA